MLTNLTSVHENHAPIVSGGGIKGFVKAMLNEDAMVSRFGILGLMNLTTLPQNHREVMNCNCCDILISLAAGQTLSAVLIPAGSVTASGFLYS